ncbi:esterase [Sulfolobus sp. A20]|uniref:PaaI family thioesterase n=1 Tax=Sulfolobaceae TaxID=118883 RepID=UPI0008462682|nr:MULTISPECIES: PaaI family thioesterase [unclassified Sulfolobus]TRM74372.1 PaaI family thioesterase [Sulfolobus sp. B5]TRM80407.1 PaaI family thioesterase [Sulfolobus sp. D5]TRM83991.1 PaaI family thioesterase [Sulfolobus sp. A20-N-F6]TRM94505.1 PaaI family thioesterase [Sulfolobus sp. A20-N-G8]TRM99342.1 PaaI family thioesterase [Sulfolobus sp. E1]TRN04159.1 PaaI family thioesterase [Sulfolobus sp. F1]
MISVEELNEVLKQEEIFNFIGIKFEKIDKGYAKLSFNYSDRLSRIGGILHGGVMLTAIDYAGSMAAKSLDNVKDEVTAELKVNFIKPMKQGPFTVEGKVISEGNRLVVIEISAYDGNGSLCAKALGTWVVYRF